MPDRRPHERAPPRGARTGPGHAGQGAIDPLTNEVQHGTIEAETELGLSRTGKDVGTPILTLAPGTDREASIFGPVIARIPRGEEALRIWDAAELLVHTPGFAELKRSARDRPTFG